MNTNSLTELLKTFSAKEIKDFKDFLRSPYFNKRKAVSDLFENISKHHPGYESESLTKETLFCNLFPQKKYNDSTLRVLMHYLTELSDEFLVHNRLKNDKLEYSVFIENELRFRKQFKVLKKKIIISDKLIETNNPDAEDYYYYKYRLSNEKATFFYESHYAFYEKIIDKANWENVFNDLTNFYHIKSMLMYLNSITINRLYNKDFKSEKFTGMINNIDPEDHEDAPIIKIYYYILKMIIDLNDETHFYKVKSLVQKNKNLFNKFDLMGAYIYMNQYCIKKISEGETKFEKESFQIYKDELKEKTYLMNDGTMAPLFYRNVVNTGLRLNELPFVKDFIYKYKSELSKKYRDNYFHYCLALYEFHSGNFNVSMDINSMIKYDELYMKLKSKTLQMQLLYETNGDESLIDYLESFRHFLMNNKLLPVNSKLQYSNFHKYLSKLIIYKTKKIKTDTGILTGSLIKEKNIICKEWLLEKLRLLKN